jgi:hypothetical protein
MDHPVLSWAAARFLQELVADARHDIRTGSASYSNTADADAALENLDQLDLLAEQMLSGMPA